MLFGLGFGLGDDQNELFLMLAEYRPDGKGSGNEC